MTQEDEVQEETSENPDEQEQELELPEDSEESDGDSPSVEELQKRLANKEAALKRVAQERDKLRKKGEETKEEETPKSDFLSKEDFYKANERKAILMATRASETDSDEAKAQKEFVKENWDDISKLYSVRAGKETPEDIFDDIQDAITLYKAKNPPQEDDDSNELSETKAVGKSKELSKKSTPDLQFSKPTEPEDWYEGTRELIEEKKGK